MTIDEFKNVDLRVAKIMTAERIDGSDKLVKLQLTLGDTERQILAGIGKKYTPEELVGKQIVVVANLNPRTMMGMESQGMLLAAHDKDGSPVLLAPDKEVPPGSTVG